MPAMRIALQRLLHKQRHPRKAAAHIGAAGSEPDPDHAIIEFIRLVKPFKTISKTVSISRYQALQEGSQSVKVKLSNSVKKVSASEEMAVKLT
jgi:hypothetical protein